MQVEVDVKCMRTNSGGCGLSGFGDTATLKNSQISPSDLVNYGIYLNIFLVNCGLYFLVNYNCGALFFGKLWDIFKYFWHINFLINYGIYLNIFW